MNIIPENLEKIKPDKKLLDKMDKVDLKEKVLFEKTSDFHNLKVVQSKIGKFLKYKDTYQAGIIDTPFYKGNLSYINYFLIPYLMNENIKNILIIGFGSGIIVNQYEKIFDKLKSIDIVDIEENIFEIAKKYFNFKDNKKFNYFLQDGIIFLKTTKKKYDLIVVDVANNDGVDSRFISDEYLNSIKNHLTKKGIFVSNMPSNRDILNDAFSKKIIKKYKKYFEFIKLFNGETSNKIFYKAFFDIDGIILDITNLIMISSNLDFEIKKDYSKLNSLNVDIKPFLDDFISLQ